MIIVYSSFAAYREDAHSTSLICQVVTYDSYVGDGTRRVLHDVSKEVLWDDTHEIAVRTADQKALARWAEACDWQRFHF